MSNAKKIISHQFRVDIAIKIGINSSVILTNLMHWVIKNEHNDINNHEGRYWTYNTVKAFSDIFPYMSSYQIDKSLKDMEEAGILFTGNFNKAPFDRTKWYTVNWENDIFNTENTTMHLSKNRNALHDITHLSKNRNGVAGNHKSIVPKPEMHSQVTGSPIPDINTDINTDDKPYINSLVEKQVSSTSSDSEEFSKTDSVKDEIKKEKKSPAAKKEVIEVIEYLNDVTGRAFDPENSTHAKFIRGRMGDGATVKEMKQVVDLKSNEWFQNEKMKKYIRPQTLFSKANYAEYREEYASMGEKFEAVERLKEVVNDFSKDNNLLFVWDEYETKALEEIANKLKGIMKERGDELTMENLEAVLRQMLDRLDDWNKKHFSIKYFNNNFNKTINAAKANKKSDWDALIASLD